MGEVGTAIADDINAIYWNPAGLGFHDYYPNPSDPDDERPYRQFALSFSKWLPQFNADLFYSYATYGQFIEALDGTIAANFIWMNLGEFTMTASTGQTIGKFRSGEFALGVSYGTIVAEDLAVGVQLRYIQSNLAPATQAGGSAGIGISGGFDIGVLWKPQNLSVLGLNLNDLLSLGINLQNVGPKMTYRNEADPLPTTLRFGTAFKLFENEYNDLTFAFDYAKLLVKRDSIDSDPLPKSLITGWQNPGGEYAFGLEYWYEKLIALRAGYFTEPSALGNRNFWNFGLGVRYDMFELNFSYINTIEENHPLANTMRFSMLVDFR
jgi:long-subunit fatty acid transport protein